MEGAHQLEHQDNLAVLTEDFSLVQGELLVGVQGEQGLVLVGEQREVVVQVSHLMESQLISK